MLHHASRLAEGKLTKVLVVGFEMLHELTASVPLVSGELVEPNLL
jgi:hypothetical protein